MAPVVGTVSALPARVDARPGERTWLKVLLRERHWSAEMLCGEYERAAEQVFPGQPVFAPVVKTVERWVNGQRSRLPYARHCAVLEAVFPGWTAHRLFSSPDRSERLADGRPEVGTQVVGAHSACPHCGHPVAVSVAFAAAVPGTVPGTDGSGLREAS